MSAAFQLAQLNIGTFREVPESPVNADFFDSLDRINAIADTAPGFVWRLVGDGGNATEFRVFEDPNTLLNMSVWTDLASLGAFVYRSGHVEVMRRRHEWFAPTEDFMVMWWVPAGHIPDITEARQRLDLLRSKGPTPEAFTFRQPFPSPGEAEIQPVLPVLPLMDECA
jgi:hypothetical protein